jgi:hypothetical protein
MDSDNEHQIKQFVSDAKQFLNGCLKDYGLVLYSYKSTLRSNPVLFYGFNPGYDPDIDHSLRWTIEQSLDHFENGFDVLRDEGSQERRPGLINDQRWPRSGSKKLHEIGQAPYQVRTRCLLEAVGHPDALVTNLFFHQTQDAEKLKTTLTDDFAEACWRVHKELFQVTKPKVVITCSTVVMELFKRKFVPVPRSISRINAAHYNWTCKHWNSDFFGQQIAVL